MKKLLLYLAISFVILTAIGVICSQPEQATALSPCGANPTPSMAASCAAETGRANHDVLENAEVDFSSKLSKGSN